MLIRTWTAAAIGIGLAAGTASAQTTASGRSVAGAPTATTGTPRAGTGIPNAQEKEVRVNAPGTRIEIAQAQEAAPAADPRGNMAMNDGLFAAAAAGSGLCEVATSRLALERASHPDVKEFARKMVADHTKANSELMSLASQKGMTLPTTLPVSAQAELNALMGVSGEEFDKCYVHDQIAAHIKAVGLFEAESKRGQDAQVKGWAAQTVPALKEHLMMVKKMHEACEAKEKAEQPSAH